ncbi:MAG TPA: hypothetical protein V6D10_20970 [Trichocoleus sp.]|jgi:myosin heavy subunit
MVKKRLSDLLREEAQKSGEAASEQSENQQTEGTIAPAAEKANEPAKAAPEAEPPEAAQPVEPEASPEEPSHQRKSSPTKVELEGLVAELKAALAASRQTTQQQEDALNQQITTLQASLQDQQSLIEKLQTEVQQAQSLKKELEEAKQMILQLSQANAKPAPAAPAAPAVSAPSSYQPIALSPMKPPSAQSAEPELEASRIKLDQPTGADGKLVPGNPPKYQQELRRILDHPTRPSAVPPMSSDAIKEKEQEKKLSDTDMGWVD